MRQVMTPEKYARLVELRAKISWTRKEYFEAARLERLLEKLQVKTSGEKEYR